MNRSKEFYRFQRYLHIERKKKIIKEANSYWSYKHEGVLNKGKIHCSCKMCRAKYRFNGPSISDTRKFEALREQCKENEIIK